MDYLKVSSKSSPASVAGAIAGMVKDGHPVVIQAVGAGAVNQSIKAVAIARGFLVPSGVDLWCSPSFQDIQIDGESRTAIRLSVRPFAVVPADAVNLSADAGGVSSHVATAGHTSNSTPSGATGETALPRSAEAGA